MVTSCCPCTFPTPSRDSGDTVVPLSGTCLVGQVSLSHCTSMTTLSCFDQRVLLSGTRQASSCRRELPSCANESLQTESFESHWCAAEVVRVRTSSPCTPSHTPVGSSSWRLQSHAQVTRSTTRQGETYWQEWQDLAQSLPVCVLLPVTTWAPTSLRQTQLWRRQAPWQRL